MRDKIYAFIKESVETIVFVVVMVIIIRFFIAEIRWIPSASMHPTLIEGDRVVVERMTRFFTSPNRGDIMVFYPPGEQLKTNPLAIFARLTGFFCKDIAYIKRVVGIPGDTYEIKKGFNGEYHVFINGEPLNEPYVLNNKDYIPCIDNMYCGPAEIPEGQYLMLGDNRGNSQDSRFWGLLPKERFIGRAKILFFPFNRIKYFNNINYNTNQR